MYTTGANPVIDQVATRKAIEDTLKADIEELGMNWPTAANSNNLAHYAGPVTVRLLPDKEVTDRQGTYWDFVPRPHVGSGRAPDAMGL